jgi:biopolymer transport protein ExbB
LRLFFIAVCASGCSLLFTATTPPAVAPDASLQSEDGGSSEGTERIDERFECDADTLVLFHFDGDSWQESACESCSAGESGTVARELSGAPTGGDMVVLSGGQHLTIAPSCLEPVSVWTIELWLRPDVLAGQSHWVAAVEEGVLGDKRWSLGLTPTGTVTALKTSESCGISESVTTTAKVSLGSWHHLRYTYDGSHIAIYIDGVERTRSRVSDSTTCEEGLFPLTIGSHGDGSLPFVGAIDELRYSRIVRPLPIPY